MRGSAVAPGAATIVNAIPTGRGCAFAVDLWTEAEVELDEDSVDITGEVHGVDEDPDLIEQVMELTLNRFDVEMGGHVSTSTEIPSSSGLKSSSAAANAVVLAVLDALDEELGELEAALIGVEAARDVGVTVTGAFDDAAASMLGGVALTDNSRDDLLHREDVDWGCAVYVPDDKQRSVDVDVERLRRVDGVVDYAFGLAVDSGYMDAMTINGLACAAAIGFDSEPAVMALSHVDGAGLSGTGPSFAAIGDKEELKEVVNEWEELKGTTLLLETTNRGAYR